MLNGSKVESKGLRISSPKNINVAVITESGCCGSEGYSALPLSHIGKEYLVTGMYNSSLTVIATESDTCVNITKRFSGKVVFNGSSYHYGDVISITLNRLQTLQLLVKGGYMIGSTISSDKPVGVVSGQYFGSLSLSSQSKLDFNQMMEYIPPMKNLGTIFIVSPIVNATYMRLIVFRAEKDTRFEIETEGFKKERIVRQYGSSVLTVSGSKPYVIRADNPVTLVQYPHGIKTFMMYIPNVDNYSNRMTFYTPNGYSSFVAIILKANDVDGLRIDGKPLHSIMIYRTNTIVDNFSFYIVITMRVESGSHVISHVDKHAKFGLVTYGFNAFSSYGFPLFMN
ncbi:hypothetical protein FSP39_022093 [Pinctada imbricata]|uniref:IgGFc-binding protein N-terminal domain-containing protein n=1 Tax=Pinctada imbricata TaxID=66713 RepID=A0AA88YL47_PINIB|nr:hypothetical protein FSP39_022093 [Pinctada imbricata]